MTTETEKADRVKRPKRAPIGEKRRTFTFRLSDDVRERVELSAAHAGRSMSEELEWRVQRSLDEEERLLQRFVSSENLNVFAAIASSWKAISIFSGKDWSEDSETLDLCKKSAVNIISWMKAYKLKPQDYSPSNAAETAEVPGGLSGLSALGADYYGPEQNNIKQDRLAWESARWAIGLCTGKPDMDSRQDSLMLAGQLYRDPDTKLNLLGETAEEAKNRRQAEPMQSEHDQTPINKD